MERGMTKCQKNDAIAKIVFCNQERAREKTEDMRTNMLTPLGNRNLSTLGS